MSSCARQSQHQPSPPLTTFSDTPQHLPKLLTTDLQSSTQGDGSRGLQCLTKLQLRSCHTRAEFCTSPSVCWCQVAEAPGEAFPRVTDWASLSTGNPPPTHKRVMQGGPTPHKHHQCNPLLWLGVLVLLQHRWVPPARPGRAVLAD